MGNHSLTKMNIRLHDHRVNSYIVLHMYIVLSVEMVPILAVVDGIASQPHVAQTLENVLTVTRYP